MAVIEEAESPAGSSQQPEAQPLPESSMTSEKAEVPAQQTPSERQQAILAKIALGSEHKAKGNEFFRNGNLQGAIKEYHHAVLYLSGLDRTMTESMAEDISSEEVAARKGLNDTVDNDLSLIYSNMAQVHLKNQKFQRALDCADQALKKNPKNFKASMRKATSLNLLGEVLKTKALLETLKKQEGADLKEIEKLTAQIDKEEAARSKKSDSAFRGMFAKVSAS